jgi:hypothetical protein
MPFDSRRQRSFDAGARIARVPQTLTKCALYGAIAAMLLSPVMLAQAPAAPQAAPEATQPPPSPTNVRAIPENEPAPVPKVEVSDVEAPLAPGAVHRFDAVISGTTNPNITWTATGGSIADDGTYTAGTTPGTFTVTGTLTGGTVYATALVVVGEAAAVATSYLSDREWTSATNGWGPVEKDRSNGDLPALDGRTLTLNGVTYAKGLGTHAASEVRYALDGGCSTFNAVVGIDDEMTSTAAGAVFQVWADSVKVFDSGMMTSAMAGKAVSVSVAKAAELVLITTDGGNGQDSDHTDWADARLACSGAATYLSDRTWTSATNGWGPAEKDKSNGDMPANDGKTLTLNGVTYAKGLGVHAASDLRYALNGACTVLTAVIGIDDEIVASGNVIFQVWSDGVKKYESPPQTPTMPGTSINVDISGARELALIVTDNGTGDSDHADWANAKVICSTDTAPPTITAVTPVSGATEVALTANATATFSEAMTPGSLTAATVTLTAAGSATPIAAAVTYAAATNTVTLDPTADLAGKVVHTLTIMGGAAGASDAAGNRLAANRVVTFTTATPPDRVPPTVTAITPAAGATGIALASNITATFSEAMTPATVTTATVLLTAAGSATPVAATVTYAAASNSVTLDPSADLTGSVVYTVTIKGGTAGVKDASANPLAADRVATFTTTKPAAALTWTYLSDRPWTSMTNGYGPVERDRSNGEDATGDGAALTLNGITYAKGLGAHAPSDIRFALNGACSAFAAVVGVDDEVGNNGSLALQVWTDGVQRFDSTLMTGASASKTVALDITGAKEIALIVNDGGNGRSYEHADWADAKVACTDTAAPTITAVSPANGATNVALATTATATFSEPMTPGSITAATVTLLPAGSTTPVPAAISYATATNMVTLTPTASLTAKLVYTFTIKGGTGGVKDAAGNALAADRVVTFTTIPPADTVPPTVTAVSPVGGATAVALATNITATFSEALAATSISTATVVLTPQGSTTPVMAALTYAAATNSLTLDPAADLLGGVVYTLTIRGGAAGVKDLADNALVANRVSSFTTTTPVARVSRTYLSDLSWTSMTNGYGPVERDRSNGEDGPGDGTTLTLNGITYAKGLGVHAPSDVRFALNGVCSLFTATVGVDDEVGINGSLVFQVWTDGVQRFDSTLMTGASVNKAVSVDITGAKELTLIVTDGGNGRTYEHADWADAQVACTDTVAPTVTSTSAIAGATAVGINANTTATFSEAMAAASITTATMTLTPQGSTTPVAAAVTYNTATQTATLDPTATLASNTLYTATVKKASTDTAGNAMAADKVWTFTTSSIVVPQGLPINPGEDIQSKVNANPPNTAFVLKAGIHRMQTIRSKDGDTFSGEVGTILSGARLLTTFTKEGALWVASGQTQQGNRQGDEWCQSGYPRCAYPEDLFINDVPMRHVGTKAEVSAGRYWFDYDGDRIYFANDPTGKRVETSVTPAAFEASGSGVTIQGMIIEHFASPAQSGAINATASVGWKILDNEVRWNHGVGVRVGTNHQMLRNNIHHNGQIGVGGGGTNSLMEGNEIAYNNTNHYDWAWEAGGAKWAGTTGLIVRNNFAHHNIGPGLWTDIDNLNTTYEGNVVEDNLWAGIFHEISCNAVIKNNTLRRNGFGQSDWVWGAGILIAASRDVEVFGNTLEGNADGIILVQQNRGSSAGACGVAVNRVRNVFVHHNKTTALQGSTGMAQDIGDDSLFTSSNNRFQDNTYQLGPTGSFFSWMNGDRNDGQWKGYGMDVNGTFVH